MPETMARFLKNVTYDLTDTSSADSSKGGQVGTYKVAEGNKQYLSNLVLPEGFNHAIGVFSSKETKEVFVFVYNDKDKHTVYKLNGYDQTYNIIFQDPVLGFQLNPENFIHFCGATLKYQFLTNNKGIKIRRTFLMFVDGANYQRQICVEDAIATNGYNVVQFPFFTGDYRRDLLINMGVPTPKDCIKIKEVSPDPLVNESNRLVFNSWQFRHTFIDVWGRPSEHGIISELYIPGAGNCNPSVSNLARCLDLSFKVPFPHIDKIQVEYRNGNDLQWRKSDTIDLFTESAIGEWWKRTRNPDITYNQQTKEITYRFCADKECELIPREETSRLQNPLPRLSKNVSIVNKYVGLSNNKDGFLPFSQDLKSKIKGKVVSPDGTNPANTNIRSITVLVEIWHENEGSQPIYQADVGAGGGPAYGWGSYGGPSQYRAFPEYQMYFKNRNQKGLIGYLAGTNAFTISSQWYLNEITGSFTEVTDFLHPIKAGFSRERYFQRFDFTNIPKGEYVFRIASHNVDPAVDKNYQQTSTYVWGQWPYIWRSGSNPSNHPLPVNDKKELVINVCDKNYDSREDNKILTIFDVVDGSTVVQQGYLKNTDEVDELQVGIELAKVTVTGGRKINAYTDYTDHNGFYWMSGEVSDYFDSNRFTYRLFAACGCEFGEQFRGRSGTNYRTYTNNYFMNKSNCQDYQGKVCSHVKIKGRVKICGTNIGLPGVGVVLSRGQQVTTDQNGYYTIIAHDDIRSGRRIDNVTFITNSCGFTDCNDKCLEPYKIDFSQCTGCTERIINVPDRFIKFFDVVRGALSGGTYPWGVTGFDWLGRATFVQPLGNFKIPSFQDSKVFAPSLLMASIDPSAIFPPEIEYITFWVGEETTIQDYITWIVDDVQFIDNGGLVNQVAPTQIRIYYSSLLEYNKQNAYATNTNWGFIDKEVNEAVVEDKVEFLLNGDGQFFDKAITGLVKYDKAGQYILINYTEDLKNLKSNAVIRIVRPKKCIDTEPLFEVCAVVDIKNRQATVKDVILPFYDTYYQKREIPVPVLQTPANPNATPPTPDIFANELRILGVPFESKHITDFWGSDTKNIGRINSKNPYETEIYNINQVALSGALSDSGILNYLNYFDTARKFEFDENSLNGIMGLVVKPGIILIIGQNNSVVVGFNDNQVRVNQNGDVVVPGRDNTFGKPRPTPAANYGCLLMYKNTIYEKDGIVQFVDPTKGWLIQHNFEVGYPVSTLSCDGYFRSKIKSIDQYNNSHELKRYMTGVINSVGNEYILTDFIIKQDSYVNNLRYFDVDVQETMCFNVISKTLKEWASFTAEAYAELEGERTNQQLFSFKNGVPYSHYSTTGVKKYLNFYGKKVDAVIEPVIVIDPFVKKRPLVLAQYTNGTVFFSDRVITETKQVSRILKTYWMKSNFGWFAPFLCDVNTPVDGNRKIFAVTDGNQLVGTWIKVRLINNGDSYSEFQGLTVGVFGDTNTGNKK